MKFRYWNAILGWLLLLAGGCVEPYTPEVLEAPNSFLVVNGFINANGPTTIQLLRTQNLSEETMPPAETRALVRIESDNGEGYTLQETGLGSYTIGPLHLSPLQQYRLFIRTSNGKEYASDFVEAKQTPAIDEVSWAPVDNEVQIYVSSHDPSNNTWYYRWEFESTWQFRSALFSNFKYVNDTVEFRTDADPPIYHCWKSANSTSIQLSNSVRLSQDVISKFRLFTLPSDAEQLGIKYSILVKQYALTRDAYEYWETLKKNTESMGTLFDPLPSQLKGNIRNLQDPNEPVVGFMSASTTQEKRMFINSRDLPREWRLFNPTCQLPDTFLFSRDRVADYFRSGVLIPLNELYPEGSPFPVGYTYSNLNCVDCRTKGTNVKPAYWE
ncbi:uncharacterized protein DUF4249 [Pontibacter mucosus]|uniref:Uncharacterized protein DUF4249 n=1 Tax=Pontibacter mucosus TaxID=1649266 RepID=A0A2T5YNZ6_9BACT|nr:DUF4249 domain-containing protein [Pontibacter mucosus]PTX21041.1 uncharacterized protein DUF4249 [Pontibacter mucosus]